MTEPRSAQAARVAAAAVPSQQNVLYAYAQPTTTTGSGTLYTPTIVNTGTTAMNYNAASLAGGSR